MCLHRLNGRNIEAPDLVPRLQLAGRPGLVTSSAFQVSAFRDKVVPSFLDEDGAGDIPRDLIVLDRGIRQHNFDSGDCLKMMHGHCNESFNDKCISCVLPLQVGSMVAGQRNGLGTLASTRIRKMV